MKVVASDVGAYQREEWIESLVIAPAERYVVHVQFSRPGSVALVNRVRGLDHLYGRFFFQSDTLGLVQVGSTPIGFGARRKPETTRMIGRTPRTATAAPRRLEWQP